jgi:hypothetical protein
MRKNMKIPRKKEKSEQPIDQFEPTRSSQAEGMEGSCDEEQCM